MPQYLQDNKHRYNVVTVFTTAASCFVEDGKQAMLCYAMLCYAMPCCVLLCCAVLCCAMLCYAVLCWAVLPAKTSAVRVAGMYTKLPETEGCMGDICENPFVTREHRASENLR